MHWTAWGSGPHFWFPGGLIWIAMLIFLAVCLIRWMSTRNWDFLYRYPGMPASSPSALEILSQRYARGEIDTATFEHMRERLESSARPKL